MVDAETRRRLQKPRPHKLVKQDDDRDWKKIDDAESEKVKRRSNGRCEVRAPWRCMRRAFQVHHHLGGWKIRGRGESALAKNKTHACNKCHSDITGNVLEHVGGNHYRRIR